MTLSIRIDRKSYAGSHGIAVLQDVHIDVASAELIAIVGPSGCGKRTLLHIAAGLDKDFIGQIDWPRAQAPRLGYVFQNPRLLPWLTVHNNVRLVLKNPDAMDQRVADLLASMGLADYADYFPRQLSVGMQRRAALARAFAVEPQLLLLDEPFVSLDKPTARQLRLLLLDLWSTHRSRVLFVTHDLQEATLLADRILFLSTTPARIIGETGVRIPREQRADESLVHARYLELKQQFDGHYRSAGTSP